MQALLDWIVSLGTAEAAVYALAANVVVFVLALASGECVARLWANHRVAPPSPAISRTELVLAGACVVLDSVVVFAGWVLYRAGVIALATRVTLLTVVIDAVVLVVVMDLAMYLTHRLAHHPLAFRWIHGIHHRYDAPRPLTLFVLHPLEVLGFGALWLLVLSAYRFSFGGILVFLTTNIAFGTLGHVGVEPLPRSFPRWPLLGSIGTTTFHTRHHRAPESNFGFYTTIWDRLFGTLDPTYVSSFGRPPD